MTTGPWTHHVSGDYHVAHVAAVCDPVNRTECRDWATLPEVKPRQCQWCVDHEQSLDGMRDRHRQR